MSYTVEKANCPLVLTLHGLSRPSEMGKSFSGAALWLIYKSYARRLLKNTSSIICVSSDTARRVEAIFPHMLEKCTVIPNGIEPAVERQRSGQSRESTRDELGLGNAFTFIYVGRVTESKGIDVLASSAANLMTKGENVSLLVVGTGSELARMKEKYSRFPAIRFLGFREDVGSYYKAADVAVLASVREGMSTFLLEAMYHGLAILATDVGGVQELLEIGTKCRILPKVGPLEVTDGLLYYLNLDSSQFKKLGPANAALVNQHFSWSRLADRTLSVYQKAIDGFDI